MITKQTQRALLTYITNIVLSSLISKPEDNYRYIFIEQSERGISSRSVPLYRGAAKECNCCNPEYLNSVSPSLNR